MENYPLKLKKGNKTIEYKKTCQVIRVRINKIKKLSSFKSNENIHKREDGSYYLLSANKASSVTL